jgi:hypothetical protein
MIRLNEILNEWIQNRITTNTDTKEVWEAYLRERKVKL